jgi:serine/threonine protein kinase
VPLQAITATEPIPGYRIRERIGAGGYGEVWTADAPGGLLKAIKFVYGFLNEDRASRELKALNRIKTVRHPFLLSLERIEIVDGQLLIVTELAEASLKERFDECQANGLAGIPREELVSYMRDTADVLDFMNEEHSLQHLDIKPENLLMLAGRVKVADFGLVKDIQDATASLMGGLTPLYAPPEVFDGRPSRRSDQYSLAIVYQEMLTGDLPFPGTTAMQLARQHMHARPRLSSLPDHDQEVIARALSKSPEDRFPNCRGLLDALERAAQESAAVEVKGVTSQRSPDRDSQSDSTSPLAEEAFQTHVIPGSSDSRETPMQANASLLPRVNPSPEVTVLPPIEMADNETISAVPTLFLGAGRSAGRIMVQLRRRLADRFGELGNVPVFQMLLLDTDGKDLMQAAHHRHGLESHEILSLPIRRPQDYRTDSRRLLSWLGRRWLYNIPKSLKTEGLRPLGRLALVDHAGQVKARIQKAITAAIDGESLGTTRQATQLEIEEGKLRVVLISSISGGTGGGMIADLAYLSRHILGQMGLPDDNVCGVLTHSTGCTPREAELSVVNAYATLSELNHFGRLGSCYPGDEICQIPPRREDNLAFRDTYLIDLGQGINEREFDEAADKVATYLYMDLATNAKNFFQACRDAEPRHPDTRNAEIRLRTFGLHQFSCMQDDVVDVTVEHVCRHAIDRWMLGTVVETDPMVLQRSSAPIRDAKSSTSPPAYSHLQIAAERFAESLRLDVDTLTQDMLRIVEHELGRSAVAYFREGVERLNLQEAIKSPESVSDLISQYKESIDAVLGSRRTSEEHGRSESGSLEPSIAPLRAKAAQKRSAAIREWLLDMVDDDTARIRGAQWLGKWLLKLANTTEENAKSLRQQIHQELAESGKILEMLSSLRGRNREAIMGRQLRSALEQYSERRFLERILDSVESIARTAKGQIVAVQEQLVDIERDLRHIAGEFNTSKTFDSLQEDDENGANDLLDSVGNVLVQRADELVERFDRAATERLLTPAGGLRRLIEKGGDARNSLSGSLRALARTTVVGVIKTLDAANVLFHNEQKEENDVNTLAESLELAKPALLACGGSRRLLIMRPKGSSQVRPLQIMYEQMHEVPSVLENVDGDFVLCHEAEQISLTQVAVSIIDGRQDFAEFASRLHTRIDVSWSHLPDLV